MHFSVNILLPVFHLLQAFSVFIIYCISFGHGITNFYLLVHLCSNLQYDLFIKWLKNVLINKKVYFLLKT